jgi:LPXTG-motif cell wall-anchored protein
LHFDTLEINNRIIKLQNKRNQDSENFKTLSDIAANLLKIGKIDSAIKILRPLIPKNPNEYNLFANLGTAYELVDELDSAIKYISKGLQLNANSHYGSEWIHVKILEAKILEKKSPGWLRNNRIITVEDLLVKMNNTENRIDLRILNRHVFYQIRTRVPFTPAPNKVISNLLLTLGDFNKQVGTYENALLAYIYSIKFAESISSEEYTKDKIKELNKLRDSQSKIDELPQVFIKMMKRSKIDPEILLIGIDDYANQLDSLHLSEIIVSDSLKLMQIQIDSIKSTNAKEIEIKDNQISDEESNKYLFLLLGLLIGIALTFLILRKKKN